MIKEGDKLQDNIVFDCIVEREIYSSDNYKIYGVLIDEYKYPNITINKYGNVTIVGNFHKLEIGTRYLVTSKEATSKYGKQYEVINIKRDIPTSKEETAKFLYEILTFNQADTLLSVYPDIVNKIIEDDLDDVDLEKTKGIKEASFAKIKNKVIENFALVEIIDKYGGNGITISMLKKLYDKYSSVEKVEQELNKNPYKSLCNISGIGFIKADTIIQRLPCELVGKKEDILKSKQRMKACIEYTLAENEKNGNTKMNIINLRKQCIEMTPECINHFVEIIKDDTSIFLHKPTKAVARTKTYNSEVYVANTIKKMLKNPRIYDFDWRVYNEIDGISLTDQQLNVLKNLCENNISLLAGLAGSGKTFTLQALINILDDNNLTYLLMAPTGKAADVLAEYTNKDASTIHRGLGYNPAEGWMYNEDNKLEYDVIIVDETGMADIFLLRRLFEAIDTDKTKILFVQDPAQLPSVGAGNCSDDMIKSNVIPTTVLDKIFRYDEGGLYNVATNIRKGKYYIPKTDKKMVSFGEKKDYILLDIKQDDMVDAIVNLYEKLLTEGNTIDDIMVLSHHNKGEYGSKVLNKKIQDKINPINDNKKSIRYGNTNYIVGDKVIQIENNYKAKDINGKDMPVYNGNTGIIKNIINKDIIIQFNKNLIVYGEDELKQLLLGYAMSIYKCQGDNSKNVIVITPKAHTFFINRNLLYTAITRTKEKCYHFSNKKLIKSALRKSATNERNTFLKELLQTI